MTHLMIPPKEAGESGRQYAYRVLYNAIMTLQLPPSEVLSDSELSQALQISRTPIREAIVSLQEAKLGEVFPQRASIVSHIDLDAIEEGVVIVNVTVNPQGRVVSANAKTASLELKRAAEKAAREIKFNNVSNLTENEEGTITFRFNMSY